MGLARSLVLISGLLWSQLALAKKGKDEDGTPITIRVLDAEAVPIATAVVRHPDEADNHRVNSATGEWQASVLYMPDGSELVFEPGQTLELEVSAPGFVTQIVQYDVRKKRNLLEIELQPVDYGEDDFADPVIQFGRDRPRDVVTTSPAN